MKAEPPERLVVPASLAGERLDRALALITGWSRQAVADLIGADEVLVDGRPVARSLRLAGGETVELLSEPGVSAPPTGEPVAFEVRHADPDVLVVAKPAGLVVHPGPGHEHGTLVHGLLHRYPEIAGVGDPARPGIVHRLDRDTSGLLLVARSPVAYDTLVRAMAAREIERQYVALVWGVPDAPRGVIDAPIGRSVRRRTRMAIRAAGRAARTGYEVREELDNRRFALLDCSLETGRTHQIRVHLSSIGHPVVGDATYGGSRADTGVERPFLHAAALSLDHPVSGERVEVHEPLPEDLEALLGRLRGSASPGSVGVAG
ncbi:MAG: RluA family pseudouridine synthase [Acidimicrobiia bacterium]